MEDYNNGCLESLAIMIACLILFALIAYCFLFLLFIVVTKLFLVLILIIAIIVSYILYGIYRTHRVKSLKKKYPNAFNFFARQFTSGVDDIDYYDRVDIKHFLSIKEKEWVRVEEQEQVVEQYEKMMKQYPDGITCWKKKYPTATLTEIVSNIEVVKCFDKRHKEFLVAKEWERNQNEFAELCRSKKSVAPHSSCCSYNIDFQKIDYKGKVIKGKYRIWQFFFLEFCTANNLDYTHFGWIQENNINIEKYKEGKMQFPSYCSKEICNFIKSLDVPVQLITFGSEINENLQVQILSLDLAKLGFQSSAFHYVNNLSSNYVVIIDGVTTQQEFVQRCESVIKKFELQKPCIVYVSLMKEYSRGEMKSLIDKKTIDVQIRNEIKYISNALKSADIETVKEKVQTIKNLAKTQEVDKELIAVINKTEEKVKSDYAIGFIDNFEIQYVDYFIPPFAQDENKWKYPVIKYPEVGCIVFPYRRKAIARRGFSEANFQKYLQDVFKECDLLILGDCNILLIEDNRPFEPDIAIISRKQPSIRIDIEIDEPYVGFTRKPIHYIGCGDDFRDARLNSNGWIVIRFTEYQVFFNPKECAALIAQVLHYIQPSMVLPINLLSCPTPKESKRWTEIETRVMACENIREKYLNHEFGIVNNEKLEVSDIKQTEKEKICAQNVKPLVLSSHKEVNYTIEESSFCERDVHIQFYPQEHIYLYNGQEQLIPVSSVISCFFTPFDSFYWSEYKANQRHVSQGQVLEEWDAKGACSRDVGTFMHQQIENYYNGFTYQQEFFFKYKGKYVQIEEHIKLEHEYLQFMKFLKNHKFRPFRTEWAIYDEELKIAGTIDMIHKRGEVFDVYDWKRSHRIVDFWGNPITINNFGEKGLGELCQIDDTPYWHYCIQQNLYRYILEKKYGMKVEKMYLVVFCDDVNEYKKLDVPYMDETINSIVKACNNGTVKERLISLRGENLS